jgi:hypothetical protein
VINRTWYYTLPENIEELHLFGAGLTGILNDQNSTLYGDGTFANVLIGGTGDNYIAGGAGNDTIEGGGGIDLMFGGGGDNDFVFTRPDEAPPGTRIGDFTLGQDKLDFSAMRTTGSDPGQFLFFTGTNAFSDTAGEVREEIQDADTVIQGDVNGDGVADFQIALTNAPVLQSSDFVFTPPPPCYRVGTRLLTARGDVAVEALAVGDHVITGAGDPKPVTWIGHRRVNCARHPDPRRVWPVRVQADAFADGLPQRDLWLSPDHAVFVEEGLIPIRHLINGTTIRQVPTSHVTYYHVELQRHAVVFAEGLAAESYLDTGNRSTFVNGGDVVTLHPTFASPKSWSGDAAAPLVNDEARVRPVWQWLAERAHAMGQPIPERMFTDDPAVELEIGTQRVRAVVSEPHRCVFHVERQAGPLRLLSRSGYPTDSRPWIDDYRRLGVYVRGIVWHDAGDAAHDIPVDDPALADGWWQVERDGTRPLRWTNGRALLPPLPDAVRVEFQLAGGMRYCLDEAQFALTVGQWNSCSPPVMKLASAGGSRTSNTAWRSPVWRVSV